jgi:hypothetical protein
MKRIIEGKAYNTETADHVASASDSYQDDRGRGHVLKYGLYRTKTGGFFLAQTDIMPDEEPGPYPEVAFFPIGYDTAHDFASGKKYSLGRYNEMRALQVERLMDGIFPAVPEAAEDGPAALRAI